MQHKKTDLSEVQIGVISDIHNNVVAFKTCVEYMKSRGIHEFIFLGDYVSDTTYVRESMDYLCRLCEENKVWIIRGNREEYMISQWKVRNGAEEGPLWKNNSCSGNLLFTLERLEEKDIRFFEDLPISLRFDYEDYPSITCCHGSPASTRELMQLDGENTVQWLQQIDTDYLLAAHTHFPGETHLGGKTYFNSGCVGIAIEDVGNAQCMILHGVTREGEKRWEGEFLSLPYDVRTVVRDIFKEGLSARAPWFINANLHIFLTGIDRCAQLVQLAGKLSGQTWPDVEEAYFEEAAAMLEIPDYRKPENLAVTWYGSLETNDTFS